MSTLRAKLNRRKTGAADFDPSLERAFECYYPSIFRYFRYRGADAETANDLASETFERALANLGRFDPARAQIQTWLFAIARNLTTNHWKKETAHPTASLDELDLPVQDGPTPEENLILDQDRQEVLQALQALDPRAMEIIALKFGGRLTNRQIAGLVDLSDGNVGIILYRSLLKLRAALAPARTEVLDER